MKTENKFKKKKYRVTFSTRDEDPIVRECIMEFRNLSECYQYILLENYVPILITEIKDLTFIEKKLG